MVKFVRENPEYTGIYACINAGTEEKTKKGSVKTETRDGVPLQHRSGYPFIQFVLGDDTDEIISFVKATIKAYSPRIQMHKLRRNPEQAKPGRGW